MKSTLVGSGGKQGYLWLVPMMPISHIYMYIVCMVEFIKRGVQLNNMQKIESLHGKMLVNRFFTPLEASLAASWEAVGSDPRD